MIDDHYIYVFVRQDISLPEQLVHAAHAAYHMGMLLAPVEGVPSLVVVGVPHVGALGKVLTKVRNSHIQHYIFADPDTNYGPSAIATEPLNKEQKAVMANYRLWKHHSGGLGESRPATSLSTPEPSPHSSGQEHSVFNGEAAD